MSTPAAPGTPPPPPPPYPPSPPRTDPPRWAWWVGGIAIPLVGILVTVVFGGNDPGPAAAPAPGSDNSATQPASTGPSGTPSSEEPEPEPPAPSDDAPTASASASASASPEADLTAPDGYAKALSTMWGLAPVPCTQHEQQLIDLDDGTSRTEDENNGAVQEPGGAELLYWPDTCTGLGDYQLRALPNTRVGLLQVDAPKSFDSCRAAAGTGFGALAMSERNDREDRGFVEGAALCSVTDKGTVAMAVIEHISGSAVDDISVSGPLYVWAAAP